ncbi:rCG51380 [Rattus norvegicus]|uniref:RCG51380 n=1 Tax=Rattus norvegicus TaxID=10116 RepID=A6IZ52_RAT|nr:rCG51380 [Rattus norvegicus]
MSPLRTVWGCSRKVVRESIQGKVIKIPPSTQETIPFTSHSVI